MPITFRSMTCKESTMKWFKYYIFDFDGTLVDSMPYWSLSMITVLERNNVKYPSNIIEKITPLGNIGAAKYFIDTFGIKMSVNEIVDEIVDVAYPYYRDTVILKDGVKNYISAIKENGGSLSILTASPHKTVDACLKRIGIFDWFDNVWSCEDFGTTKSDPNIYISAVERLGGCIKEAIFFDDNIGAIKTAKQAGLFTVGVYDRSGEGFKSEIINASDMFIDSFIDI